MTLLSQTVFNLSQTTHSFVNEIASSEQGGFDLPGARLNDVTTSTSTLVDPLRMWIIQVGVIMVTTQLLSLFLRKIRQPRVIAEVIGGIILSPSGLGRIPGFTQTIFPDASKPYLSLVANIGLVLFLFLVGLEIDGGVIRRNARLSVSIALGGMIIPFGLGSAFSVALYKEFIDPDTKFSHFLLFVGVAFSITAFPVLCRILTELKLLDTTVGVVVLSAGVANDVVGWTLLALSVALANSASGLTALWILLTCVGWSVFLLFPVRRIFQWLARRTGSIDNGPTMFFMTATMLMVLCSALFTDVIGVHAIFGSFLAGLIIPREGGLAIALTEKLEDMVSIIFLPLYFTLSGLSTDFGLLNNGITWAYTIGIVAIAWTGKFGGCTIAARLTGFRWREAASIGTLMSCKGLVELIVLNVGLSAGILNTRVFSMFVLEALLLTFLTTPVVVVLYPPKYRKRAVAAGADCDGIDVHDQAPDKDAIVPQFSAIEQDVWKTRFTVVLDKLEHLPCIMTMTQLFRPFVLGTSKQDGASHSHSSTRRCRASSSTNVTTVSPVMDALRLIELSDRTSAVMKSSMVDSLIHTDPLLNVFKTFCNINDISVSASLSVDPFDRLATKVTDHARENLSHLILVPWLPYDISAAHISGHVNVNNEHHSAIAPENGAGSTNPVDILFNIGIVERSSSALHSKFVRGIFTQASVDVALFVDRGLTGHGHYSSQHVILPFFGGPDDRLALRMAVQLCGNLKTTAKIFRVMKSSLAVGEPETSDLDNIVVKDKHRDTLTTDAPDRGHAATSEHSDTRYSGITTQTRLQSGTADDILWQNFVSPSSSISPAIRTALTRVEFVEMESPTPLRDILIKAEKQTDIAVEENARLFIVVGRGRRLVTETHREELERLLEERGHVAPEVRKTMGGVATAFLASGDKAGLVVVQAAET